MLNVWRVIPLLLAFTVGGGLLGMRIASRTAGAAKSGTQPSQTWVCPMHPGVQSEQPGKCPICGMDLVRKKPVSAKRFQELAEVKGEYPGVVVQNLAVRLATVARRELAQEVTTYGTATMPGAGALTVAPKVEGWVRTLYVSTAGQKVSENQPLYDFYSPELIQRQREYIDLLNRKETLASQIRDVSGQNAQVLAALARDRVNMRRTLLAADLDLDTLSFVERSRRPVEVITVRAAQPSLVTAVAVTAGAFVTPMTPILSLAPSSNVWIDVLLYPDQANWIRGGERATVHSGTYVTTGRLELPNLLVDPVSKVLHGRVEVPFTDSIRPGSAVTVSVACSLRRVLAVPSAALIRRAQRDYVMLWEGSGQFRPVEITVGIRSRDFVEVRRGLAEGDRTAAAGEFLVEADSSLERNQAGPPS